MLSNVDFKIVNCPFKLLFATSYILLHAPVDCLTADVSFLKSLSELFTTASIPDIPAFPAITDAYCDFSASVKPENAFLLSCIIVAKLFIFPLESVRDKPSLSIAPCTASVGAAILDIQLLIAVPALLAFTPEFAINPIATDVSFMLNPSAPATGAQYLNDSPIIATFVFAFDEAAAITSAKLPASFAVFPKAVNESVNISEVSAKSSPDAPASFITGSIPFNMSFVFQPAIAMY